MKWWKVYFGFMAVYYAIVLVEAILKPSLMTAAGALFDTLTLIALYGFCFSRKIGLNRYWKIGFFVVVFQELVFSPIQDRKSTRLNSSH